MKENTKAPVKPGPVPPAKPARKTAKKAEAPNDTAAVNAFMNSLAHPLKAEMEEVRNIILSSNPKLKERIKWNAPSFFYKKDMAVFHPRAQDCVHIVFVFYDGEMVADDISLLEGDYKDRRMVKFYSMNEVKTKKATLIRIINEWIDLIDKHHPES